MATKQCLRCLGDLPTQRRQVDRSAEVMNYVQSMMRVCPIWRPIIGLHIGTGLYACRACYSKLEKGANVAATLASITGDVRWSVGLTPHDVFVVVKTVSDYFLSKVASHLVLHESQKRTHYQSDASTRKLLL